MTSHESQDDDHDNKEQEAKRTELRSEGKCVDMIFKSSNSTKDDYGPFNLEHHLKTSRFLFPGTCSTRRYESECLR